MKTDNYDALKPKISDLKVRNPDNEQVAMESLWEQRRVVLVFLRHFG